jgi:hypothetical protein
MRWLLASFVWLLGGTAALAAVQIDGTHYQATFRLACIEKTCGVDVPVPSGFSRLIVFRQSCEVRADQNVNFSSSRFQVVSPVGIALVQSFDGPNLEAAAQGGTCSIG